MATLPPLRRSQRSAPRTPTQAQPQLSKASQAQAKAQTQTQTMRSVHGAGTLRSTANRSPDLDKSTGSDSGLAKLLDLLTNEHTADLVQRHLHGLDGVLRVRSEGFMALDLHFLPRVLHSLLLRIVPIDTQPTTADSEPDSESKRASAANAAAVSSVAEKDEAMRLQYEARVLSLLNLLCVPICSDDLSTRSILLGVQPGLTALVDVLAETVHRASPPVVQTALNAANQLVNGILLQDLTEQDKLRLDPRERAWLEVAGTTLRESKLPKAVSEPLSNPNNAQLFVAAIQLTRSMSRIDSFRSFMSILEVPVTLVASLSHPLCAQDAGACALVIEALWDFFEVDDANGAEGVDSNVVSQFEPARALAHVNSALKATFKMKHRAIRNDFVLVVALLAQQPSLKVPLVMSHVFETLLRFTTCADVQSRHPDVRGVILGNNGDDFELAKLLLSCVPNFIQVVEAEPVIAASSLVEMLFKYLHVAEDYIPPRGWSATQYGELQQFSLSLLPSVAPKVLEWLVASRNISHLIHLFNMGVARAQVLKALVRIASSSHSQAANELRTEMLDQGLIEIALDFLKTNLPDVHTEPSQLHIISLLWNLCSALCLDSLHTRELFGEKGVKTVMLYLQVDLEIFKANRGHETILLSAIDAVWNCVLNCPVTQNSFLRDGGVFALLDLLQSCPVQFRNILLGVLTDLAEDTTSVQHMLEWHARRDKSVRLSTLCINCWSKATFDTGAMSLLGSIEDGEGGSSDIKFPLRPIEMQKIPESLLSDGEHEMSPAILDVFASVRAKLFCLLTLIGFERIYDMATNTEKLDLVLIEQYLNLKVGEVWDEMAQELALEGIVPVDYDEECLSIAQLVHDKTVEIVLERQQQVLLDMEDERTFANSQKLDASAMAFAEASATLGSSA
eukprot:m.6550 g.6550  ORF g.6550 m.6550 type:complete len:905 (+) comp5171_c0_seq2:193-2907(+)